MLPKYFYILILFIFFSYGSSHSNVIFSDNHAKESNSFQFSSQNYQALVSENKYWIMRRYYSLDINNISSGHAIYFKGDTSINGIVYKNVYKSNLSGTHPCPPYSQPCFEFDIPYASMDTSLIGHVRESTADMIVYFRAVSDQGCYSSEDEVTLFDFGKQVGDSLNQCLYEAVGGLTNNGYGLVDGYQEVEKFGYLRNAQTTTGFLGFIGLPFEGEINIIEGIGAENHGLFHRFWGLDEMHDYCEGDIGECQLISSATSLKLSSNIKTFPNPASDEIHITVDRAFLGSPFFIKSISGEIIMKGSMSYMHQTVNTNELMAGLYIIEIDGKKGKQISRFIKQ